MKIILTGQNGFLGTRVYDFLISRRHEVRCIPSELFRGGIDDARRCEISRIFDSFCPDAVIHTAAISDIGVSEKHPEESYIANVKLTEEMGRLASAYRCKLISCSSDQVYSGRRDILLHNESEACEPANVYARHKLEAEGLLAEICPDAVSLRLTWMYDMPLYRKHTNTGFPLLLLRAALEGQCLTFSESSFRGITYVRSVAENMEKALSLPEGVYNFGSENPLNMYSTALSLYETFGLQKRAEEILVKESGDMSSLAIDCSLIKKHGIEFETTCEGFSKMLSDYGA